MGHGSTDDATGGLPGDGEPSLSLAASLLEERGLVMLGGPGSGNTTLLRHLALHLARHALLIAMLRDTGAGEPPPAILPTARRDGARVPILPAASSLASAQQRYPGRDLADLLDTVCNSVEWTKAPRPRFDSGSHSRSAEGGQSCSSTVWRIWRTLHGQRPAERDRAASWRGAGH